MDACRLARFQLIQLLPLGFDQDAMDLFDGGFVESAQFLSGRQGSTSCRALLQRAKSGFQGGLQWYRCGTSGADAPSLEVFSGRTIDVPAMFIAGSSDWGVYQRPGAFERMQQSACTHMLGCHLIAGAGHWVQQEQPERVMQLLSDFLARLPG